MTYKILGEMPRFPGHCVKCDRRVNDTWDGVLLRNPAGVFEVAHVSCAGGRYINKVSGKSVWVGPDTLDVNP